MNRRLRGFLPALLNSLPELLLVTVWCAGICCGMILATRADDTYFSLMRRAAMSPVSIVGLAASAYLPFLLSAFAVYFGKHTFLYGICFVKALMFAMAAVGAELAFGSAGWLVRFLLQFSDILLLWLLFWFCLRHIRRESAGLRHHFGICTAAVMAVGSIDFCIISPFLAMLTEH